MVEFLFEPLLHNTFVLAAFDTIVGFQLTYMKKDRHLALLQNMLSSAIINIDGNSCFL